jgi:hypothetical protein
MLNSIIDLVRQNSGSLLQSPLIPANRQDEAVTVAGTSIFDGLKSAASGGGLSQVMQLFNGGSTSAASSPVVETITNQFAGNFASKFGIDSTAATGLAASFVPGILTKLVSKANDPSDNSIDVQSLFNGLSDGKTSGLNVSSLLAKAKAGLDVDGDGDVDLQDLKAAFGSSGIVDKVKGFFK